MADYQDNPDLSPEDEEEFEEQARNAASNPDDPDYEFFNQAGSPGGFMGGMIIPMGRLSFPFPGFMGSGNSSNSKSDRKSHLKPNHEYITLPILNREYLLRIVDACYTPANPAEGIVKDEGTVSMEVEINPNYKGKRKFKDMTTVMLHLQRSQLINFILAWYMRSASTWDLHSIDYNLLVTDEYSKILILARKLSKYAPPWAEHYYVGDGDWVTSHTTEVVTKLSQPAHVSVVRKKHLYEPLAIYEIDCSFNASTGIDTDNNFNPTAVYGQLVLPRITDAIRMFYTESLPIYEFASKAENSLHCWYDISHYSGMIRIRMVCSPAFIGLPTNDGNGVSVVDYEYLGADIHAISIEDPLAELESEDRLALANTTFSMFSRTSSTPDTQVIPVWLNPTGNIDREGREYCIYSIRSVLFTMDRFLRHPEDWMPDPDVTTKDPNVTLERWFKMDYYKCDIEDMFVAMISAGHPIKLTMSMDEHSETGYTIYGFLDGRASANGTLTGGFKVAMDKHDLINVLHLPKEFKTIVNKDRWGDPKLPKIRLMEVFRDEYIFRMMIFEPWENHF